MPTEQPWVMGVQADTADANDREELARSVRERIAAHSDWILLNTCHRVELYGFGTPPDLDARLKVRSGEGAVRHLIRVAAGLESAIIGEDEVLHQVREAVGNARAGRQVDGRLVRLFESAIAAGRRARAGRTAASGNLAPIDIEVTGVADLRDYAHVQTYLDSLTFISHASVMALTGDTIRFRLATRGGAESLQRTLSLSGRLQPIAAGDNGILRFQLRH